MAQDETGDLNRGVQEGALAPSFFFFPLPLKGEPVLPRKEGQRGWVTISTDINEPGSPWYHRVASEIENHKVSLGKKETKKYNLDLLERVAKRIDEYSHTCGECQSHKQDITTIMSDLNLLLQMPSKEGRKAYAKSRQAVVSHLKKVHKLVEPGYYTGIGMVIGAGIGAALGPALGNAAFTGIGVALGIAIGSWLERRAKKEGRVL